MQYPTIREAHNGNPEEILRWYRLLPSPGFSARLKPQVIYSEVSKRESEIMKLIATRFQMFYENGEITPELSKKVGTKRWYLY